MNFVLNLGIALFMGSCFLLFLEKKEKRKLKEKPTIIEVPIALKPRFRVDLNSQLIIELAQQEQDGSIAEAKHIFPADLTEKIAILLLPIARKVLRENGVQE